jgi:two-component system, chemotaxis family, CheB/CheR fusion protein
MYSFPVVAVASSAGDLEAVSELLSASAYSGAFVIVQHVISDHRALSVSGPIAARTILQVSDAYDDVVMKRGNVYVIVPKATLTIDNGRIRVSVGAKAPIDPANTLFASLAAAYGSAAIGVVLSGGGSDGALGIQAIRAAGGVTFAQYPGSARFPSMPISAIETGCVDFVLRPNEIARELARSIEVDHLENFRRCERLETVAAVG